jgi:hypothetical protein
MPIRKAVYSSFALTAFSRVFRERKAPVTPQDLADSLGWNLDRVQDELVDLQVAGMVGVEDGGDILVSLAVPGAARLIASHLGGAGDGWHFPWQVAMKTGINVRLVTDALAELVLEGSVEVEEPKGIRVRWRGTVPLTNDQRYIAEYYLPLARSMAAKFSKVYGCNVAVHDDLVRRACRCVYECVRDRGGATAFPGYMKACVRSAIKDSLNAKLRADLRRLRSEVWG